MNPGDNSDLERTFFYLQATPDPHARPHVVDDPASLVPLCGKSFKRAWHVSPYTGSRPICPKCKAAVRAAVIELQRGSRPPARTTRHTTGTQTKRARPLPLREDE